MCANIQILTVSIATMALAESYTLYYNRWSICSHMVRLTMAFKGQPKDGGSPMIVEEREVDIWKGEQVTEEYLTEINPKGQVSMPLCIPSMYPIRRLIALRSRC